MEYTPISEVTAVPNPCADRASAYGLEPIVVDGNDADLMYAIAVAALDKARSGGGPSLIEAQTYRHGGHSRADPGKYRPAEEVAAWMKRDPLPAYRARLLADGIDEAAITAIEDEQAARVDKAEATARESGPPPLEIADTDVWADGGSSWRN
jgi:pyruvate dehydrogenase E1 component alpha subunit